MPNILIACECSQTIANEFRRNGFNAFSCDIENCYGGHPEYHIIGDALRLIKGGTFNTVTGDIITVDKWDLIIAHPPCTYLSVAGNAYFNVEKYGKSALERIEKRTAAFNFVMYIVNNANCDRLCIENPVGYINTHYRKPNQIIHPYMFSNGPDDTENYVTKRTCFWLFNLPPLQPTFLGKRTAKYGKYNNWCESVTTNKSKIRSKTFQGVANAIVKQWGVLLNA